MMRAILGDVLLIDFALHGSPGRVRVDVEAATGPATSGRDRLAALRADSDGAGLPVCTATIDYAGAGYTAATGWVQLVRSSDSERPDVFELDPLALYAGLDTPYAFFGIAPTLYDAPHRDPGTDVVWRARSYLACSPDAVLSRAALPVVAFTWGFRIEGGVVSIEEPEEIDVARWAEHLDELEHTHPGWTFQPEDGHRPAAP